MRFEFTGRTCRLPLLQLLITAGLALLLAACGSSSTLHPGYPVLTMTATNSGGQFSSYNVTVASITLTEQNGTVAHRAADRSGQARGHLRAGLGVLGALRDLQVRGAAA
jgi:hypothetical protein